MQIYETTGFYRADLITDFTPIKNFDLVAKFWSSIRKRLFEATGLSLAAYFDYRDSPVVHCTMIPSRVSPEGVDYGQEEFEDRCVNLAIILPEYIQLMVENLENFKNSPEYRVYMALCSIPPKDTDRPFHEAVNPFLYRMGLKTEKDEKTKKRIQKKIKKSLSRL